MRHRLKHLRNIPDSSSHLSRSHNHIKTSHLRRSGCWLYKGCEHLDCCTCSSTVRAEESKYPAVPDTEIDLIDWYQHAIFPCQVQCLNGQLFYRIKSLIFGADQPFI